MNYRDVDEMGNILQVLNGQVTLNLARFPGKRNLGVINGDEYLVDRLRIADGAKGRGHFHYNLDCWLLNYEVCRQHRILGFSFVHMRGYDGQDNFHDIRRSVHDILRTPQIRHFKEQGFERQIEFPVENTTQMELFAGG